MAHVMDEMQAGEEYEAAKPYATQYNYPENPWHDHSGMCLICEGRKAADADIKRIEEIDELP